MSDTLNSPVLFAEPLQVGVSSGTITSTVRTGFRNYQPGIVLAHCPITHWRQHIHVLEVRFTEARNVEAEMMGFETQAAFYEDMKTYGEKYADFGPDSQVTVLYFVLPEKLEAERKELDELNAMTLSEGDINGHAV